MSDESSVAEAMEAVVSGLGDPTILVNNAGILRDNLLFKMTTADWDAVPGVDLRGAFLMSRAVQSYMRDAGFGRIVNVSSTSASGNRGQANYAAAKAGVQGLTKTLASDVGEVRRHRQRSSTGFIQTDMTAATAERMGIPSMASSLARRRKSRSVGSASPKTSPMPCAYPG